MTQLIRILGIDPGSVVTGYGVIETDGIRSFHVTHGHIRAAGDTFPERLGHIHQALSDVLDKWQPAEVAIEQVFVSNNAMSALKLGQARGAAIGLVVSRSVSVAEYPARSVKQAVVGTGAADKKQVQLMIGELLGISPDIQADAADGLAIALCHAHSRLPFGRSTPVGRRRGSGRARKRWSATAVSSLAAKIKN